MTMIDTDSPNGSTGTSPINDRVLFAHPQRSGFFGLTQLQQFTHQIVGPYLHAGAQETLVFDFSLVKIWDISALLWLTIALHHYRKCGLSFLLRLPEGTPSMTPKDKDAYDRSADYLRRWRFENALLNVAADPRTLLVPEQQAFFSRGEPKRFYLDRKVSTDSGLRHAPTDAGLLASLISRRLLHIRNLADPGIFADGTISDTRVTDCIAEFQSERIGDILFTQCGILKRNADLFADHLLTEALLNVREHPNATIGMLAISLIGNSGELALCVVDNGDPIPETIFPTFTRSTTRELVSTAYDTNALSLAERARIADYATQPGVTRKLGELAEHSGMGLTYIKTDTLDTFKGRLTIITDRLRLKYEAASGPSPVYEEWDHPWRGNLLRIAIPLPRLRSPARHSPSST